MIYNKFAEFYDQLFDLEMYDKWFSYTQKRIKPTDNILDLACGTGRFMITLLKNGYQVIGADFADEMLTLAKQNMLEANVDASLINADMRDLSALGQFDVVTCYDDSLCYLLAPADLEATFKEVFKHLNANGKFLFDVITPYQTDEVYPGYMYNYQGENEAFMWTSYQGEFANHSVEHELSFFYYNDEKQAYDLYTELHQERTYPVERYLQMLKEAGFKVQVTTNFGADEYQPQVKRWFFEATKG